MIRKTLEERISCNQDDKFIQAMRAFSAGTASEAQQKIAFSWIINVSCRVDESTFWPGDAAASAFLEGKRAVAIDIISLIKAKTKEEKITNG